MSRRPLMTIALILVALGAAAGGFWWIRYSSRSIAVTVSPVRVGTVEATVVSISSGTVTAAADSTLIAEHFGRVSAIRCEEGDRVSEGDVLIELDSREARARLDLAKANLRVGEARLSQARTVAEIQDSVSETDVEQARARFKNATAEFARIERLRNEDAVSTAQYDQAKLALDLAREALDAAETTLRQRAVRQQEIRAAEASVEQLKAAVEVAEAQLDKCFIRAPFDGLVAEVFVEVGESVGQVTALATTFAPMCRLVDDSSLIVEAPMDEADIGLIEVGQTAYVTFDAYPDSVVEGCVRFISPVVETSRAQNRTVAVEVELDSADEARLDGALYKVGMSADVTVVVDQKDNVLYVPTDAIMNRPEGSFVYVFEDGRVAKRAIEVGLSNWDTSEVVAGLDEGDEVVVSLDVTDLAPGARVYRATTEESDRPR